MLTERHFYHSFPRRADASSKDQRKGLAILESMLRSGFLLTPERTEWFELRRDGSRSESIVAYQKRACFTELSAAELPEHSRAFGPFALEFTIENLRRLGAVPVVYLPTPGLEESGLAGIAASLVARMADIQMVLDRLAQLATLAAGTTDKGQQVVLTRNGKSVKTTRSSIGGAEDILDMVTEGTQSPTELLNAVRAFAGFFYPTEDLKYTGFLGYYRQREWRIVANMARRSTEITRALTAREREALIALDAEFFEHLEAFPTGEYPRVAQCQYFSELDGKSVLAYANRILVPREVLSQASQIASEYGLDVPIEINAEHAVS